MPELEDVLCCPDCHGDLARAADGATCAACAAVFPVVDEIATFVAAAGRTGFKGRQAAWFDGGLDEELEIERPLGTPRLYAWHYREKFRRGTSRLEALLPGATALTVCGGSGMDAEFLARSGFGVVTADISLGAARRARERAARHRFGLESIVADVERLPFRDAAFDLVYVHDGLHHLERPLDGLAEMARVARRAIAVSEPAAAAVTSLAVRLGLALETEEAGNPVGRLALCDVTGCLASRGFLVVDAHRYAMYFKHEPGRVMRTLSVPPLYWLVRAGISGFNRLA
ncbi:MAG TPA: methyltransferase domain-containing protein, partial [Polyangiaceae bacterium]|nr:methyltransferase domain-containing protein [Polyangiaceae bacterium]